jgi:RNA polymerase sigma factor (sigma-70 family)
MERPQEKPNATVEPGVARDFCTTHWSVVLAAGDQTSPEGHAALCRLCETYWAPVYAFIRKRGHSPELAQDLTQEFFATLLEKNYLARALRERGKFRSFVMTSVQNFLHNNHDRNQAQKRGGGRVILSLKDDVAESGYQSQVTDESDPAKAFEQRWASTLLQNVFQRLREEHVESSRSGLFQELQAHLWCDPDSTPYGTLATRFGLTVGNVKVISHRLRGRCREILRHEIAQTVSQPGEIDEELRYLMRVVSQ